jgi:hypothetical protein
MQLDLGMPRPRCWGNKLAAGHSARVKRCPPEASPPI